MIIMFSTEVEGRNRNYCHPRSFISSQGPKKITKRESFRHLTKPYFSFEEKNPYFEIKHLAFKAVKNYV